MLAKSFGGRLPVISSVKAVIENSSMPVSGMAGTAGLTEGCRWNHAAVGYAGHPAHSSLAKSLDLRGIFGALTS